MKTRRMFLVALCGVAMLIGASSCKKEKQENENGETMTIKASLGSADNNSKTHLDGKKVMWDMGDAFKLFRTVSTEGTKFSLTRIDETDGKVAYFEGKHPGDAPYYACYPFNNVSCTTAGTFTFSIPQVQNDSPETVSDNSNAGPMVGFMEKASGSLVFQNAMSWLKVGLKGSVSIKRITLTDLSGVTVPAGTLELTEEMINNANNKKLNGTLTVTCSGNTFTTEMGTDGTNQLEIVSHDGFVLDGSSYTYFWFLVPNGSLVNLKLAAYISEDEDDLDVLQLPVKQIADGINGISENTIVTAEVSTTAIDVTPATATTRLGCSSEFVSQLEATVTGNDPKLKAYKIGFCYSTTNSTPTIDDCEGYWEVADSPFTIENGSSQEVTCDLTGLTEGTKYYICSYATNGKYAYGNVVEVTPESPEPLPDEWTNGKNPHPFTVANGRTVYFSQGNLQYVKSSGIWQFASHQYDIVEKRDQNVGQDYANQGIVTLFGWGTSGYNHNSKSYQPWSTSIINSDYYAYDDPTNNLNNSVGLADWGVYNAICNGGNTANKWRTMTREEWFYLFEGRSEAKKLYGEGKVGNCIPGLIILPDDWNWSGEVAGFQSRWTPGTSAWANAYTYSEWAKMEVAGAIFLPAAGYRYGTSVVEAGLGGDYWYSSHYYNNDEFGYNHACGLGFNDAISSDKGVHAYSHCNRSLGLSVRLVSDN